MCSVAHTQVRRLIFAQEAKTYLWTLHLTVCGDFTCIVSVTKMDESKSIQS